MGLGRSGTRQRSSRAAKLRSGPEWEDRGVRRRELTLGQACDGASSCASRHAAALARHGEGSSVAGSGGGEGLETLALIPCDKMAYLHSKGPKGQICTREGPKGQ
ncbi:hypothetical protein GUJ93_ZPchr0005g14809 [Zizania palustris]|uniref:Uncharacterized protein n=1 Tax=Zizania palustris TaxID=103762 RepID=A0A8J5VFI9_ZIZPA|nr:hypothetical protein GUJ93_ZPchr0005g14809 [Zizania palustris]